MIQNIFLLDGLGGTGKSDFMKHITKKYQGRPRRGAAITKITTRQRRTEEDEKKPSLDLTFVTPQTFVAHQRRGDLYTYDFGGYLYGFHKADIQKCLDDNVKHVFIIVKDKDIHRRLAHDFPRCRVIRVFIYSDREEIRKRLIADGYSEEHINFRINRISGSWFDYIQQMEVYDEIIINSSDRDHFHRIIDSLISKYDGYPWRCPFNWSTHDVSPTSVSFSSCSCLTQGGEADRSRA